MSSDARRAAGSENGKKARGRKSAAGKARSAMNALTHGVTASTVGRLSCECAGAYEQHFQTLIRLFQPADEYELSCLQRLASATWRLERLHAAETGALEIALAETAPKLEQAFESYETVVRLGAAFTHYASDAGALSRFARYEGALTRSIARARRDLEEYRRRPPAQNQKLQNEGNAPAAYALLASQGIAPGLVARAQPEPQADAAPPPLLEAAAAS